MRKILNPKKYEVGQYWDMAWSLVEGCSPVSEGCKNCWARNQARRFQKSLPERYGGLVDDNGEWTGKTNIMWNDLRKPAMKKKPTIYSVWNDLFCNSYPSITDLVIYTMWLLQQHIFLVLTKRPFLAYNYFDHDRIFRVPNVPNNLWLGTSVENQRWADERIPELLTARVPHRFLSIEPMLGRIDLTEYIHCGGCGYSAKDKKINGDHSLCVNPTELLDWVIVGCETGPKRRPCKLEWIESVVEQCRVAGVPVWVKQIEVGGKVRHKLEDFPKHLRIREMPEV